MATINKHTAINEPQKFVNAFRQQLKEQSGIDYSEERPLGNSTNFFLLEAPATPSIPMVVKASQKGFWGIPDRMIQNITGELGYSPDSVLVLLLITPIDEKDILQQTLRSCTLAQLIDLAPSLSTEKKTNCYKINLKDAEALSRLSTANQLIDQFCNQLL